LSLVLDIAMAVTAELNAAPAGTFAQPLQAVCSVLPVYELSAMADLKVTVVPKAVQIDGATRATSQFDVQVDIGIQKKLGSDLDSEVAALLDLVDQIAQYLRNRPLSAAPHAMWVSTANEPVYAPEHLADKRLFTSVLTLTYRAIA
jgi:hypothetical protein